MKNIAVVLAVFAIAAFLVFFAGQEQRKEIPAAGEPPIIVNENIPVRGLASPGDVLHSERDRSYLSLARQLGANYIGITHWIVPDINGNIVPPEKAFLGSTLEDTRNTVRLLHQQGFKVWLVVRTPLQPSDPNETPQEFTFELNPDIYKGLSPEARTRFLAALKPKILEAAVMAQEESVEMFTPVAAGQLYLVLEPRSDSAFSFNWASQLLPDVRQVYRGDLVQKIDLNPDTAQHRNIVAAADFAGWDLVSSDVFGSSDGFPGGRGEISTYSEWQHIYTSLLPILEEKKAKSGAKGIILGQELLGIDSSAGRIIVNEKGYTSQQQVTDRDLEEARAKAWEMILTDTEGKADGYFFWNWWPGADLPSIDIKKETGEKNITSRYAPASQGMLPASVIQRFYRRG